MKMNRFREGGTWNSYHTSQQMSFHDDDWRNESEEQSDRFNKTRLERDNPLDQIGGDNYSGGRQRSAPPLMSRNVGYGADYNPRKRLHDVNNSYNSSGYGYNDQRLGGRTNNDQSRYSYNNSSWNSNSGNNMIPDSAFTRDDDYQNQSGFQVNPMSDSFEQNMTKRPRYDNGSYSRRSYNDDGSKTGFGSQNNQSNDYSDNGNVGRMNTNYGSRRNDSYDSYKSSRQMNRGGYGGGYQEGSGYNSGGNDSNYGMQRNNPGNSYYGNNRMSGIPGVSRRGDWRQESQSNREMGGGYDAPSNFARPNVGGNKPPLIGTAPAGFSGVEPGPGDLANMQFDSPNLIFDLLATTYAKQAAANLLQNLVAPTEPIAPPTVQSRSKFTLDDVKRKKGPFGFLIVYYLCEEHPLNTLSKTASMFKKNFEQSFTFDEDTKKWCGKILYDGKVVLKGEDANLYTCKLNVASGAVNKLRRHYFTLLVTHSFGGNKVVNCRGEFVNRKGRLLGRMATQKDPSSTKPVKWHVPVPNLTVLKNVILDYKDNVGVINDLVFACEIPGKERLNLEKFALANGLSVEKGGGKHNRFLIVTKKNDIMNLVYYLIEINPKNQKYKLLGPGEDLRKAGIPLDKIEFKANPKKVTKGEKRKHAEESKESDPNKTEEGKEEEDWDKEEATENSNEQAPEGEVKENLNEQAPEGEVKENLNEQAPEGEVKENWDTQVEQKEGEGIVAKEEDVKEAEKTE